MSSAAQVNALDDQTRSDQIRPVALLVPLRMPVHDRQPGVWKGKVTVSEDFDALTDPDAVEWFGE